MAKNKGGRPSVMTPEIIDKLEQAFGNDMTDAEACLYAGIAPATLYDYCKKNPAFSERKEQLKNALSLHAKNNLAKQIKGGDKETSKWWLERRRKDDFSTKRENKHGFDPDAPLTILTELKDAISNKSKGLPRDSE